MTALTPAEYGRHLASLTPPVTAEQARKAALILVTVEQERAAA